MKIKQVVTLISLLEKIPSIGKKTAERYAYYLINNFNEDELNLFSKTLLEIKNLKKCSICNVTTDIDPCSNCQENFNSNTLLIVKSDQDLHQILNTKKYQGLYYSLNGLIDFNKGIGPDELNLNKLFKIIKDNKNINEVILALNSTVEGEITSKYLYSKMKLERPDVELSKLAFGIPFGSDLKYADDYTLSFAILNRKKL